MPWPADGDEVGGGGSKLVTEPPEYVIRAARSAQDLEGILALQACNLPRALSEEERRREGFVTLEHDLDLLREMNAPWPHTVATLGERLAGYALVTLPRFRERIPELAPMFDRLAGIELDGRPILESSYFVMGQVCIAQGHRGKGLLPLLYEHQRRQMAAGFQHAVTEIDATNRRSLRAHLRTGYRVVDEYTHAGKAWVVMALALR